MRQLWKSILAQFGQNVTIRQDNSEISLRALVQPVLDTNKLQNRPGPLGLEPQLRLRYLGPPEVPLSLDAALLWNNQSWRVRSTCLAGGTVCPHCWAVLEPLEEVLA